MKKPVIVIFAVTLYAIIYNSFPYLNVPESIILLMFSLSPFMVIYMAFVVLKYGKPSGNSFEDKFYDDMD